MRGDYIKSLFYDPDAPQLKSSGQLLAGQQLHPNKIMHIVEGYWYVAFGSLYIIS